MKLNTKYKTENTKHKTETKTKSKNIRKIPWQAAKATHKAVSVSLSVSLCVSWLFKPHFAQLATWLEEQRGSRKGRTWGEGRWRNKRLQDLHLNSQLFMVFMYVLLFCSPNRTKNPNEISFQVEHEQQQQQRQRQRERERQRERD